MSSDCLCRLLPPGHVSTSSRSCPANWSAERCVCVLMNSSNRTLPNSRPSGLVASNNRPYRSEDDPWVPVKTLLRDKLHLNARQAGGRPHAMAINVASPSATIMAADGLRWSSVLFDSLRQDMRRPLSRTGLSFGDTAWNSTLQSFGLGGPR